MRSKFNFSRSSSALSFRVLTLRSGNKVFCMMTFLFLSFIYTSTLSFYSFGIIKHINYLMIIISMVLSINLLYNYAFYAALFFSLFRERCGWNFHWRAPSKGVLSNQSDRIWYRERCERGASGEGMLSNRSNRIWYSERCESEVGRGSVESWRHYCVL